MAKTEILPFAHHLHLAKRKQLLHLGTRLGVGNGRVAPERVTIANSFQMLLFQHRPGWAMSLIRQYHRNQPGFPSTDHTTTRMDMYSGSGSSSF